MCVALSAPAFDLLTRRRSVLPVDSLAVELYRKKGLAALLPSVGDLWRRGALLPLPFLPVQPIPTVLLALFFVPVRASHLAV